MNRRNYIFDSADPRRIMDAGIDGASGGFLFRSYTYPGFRQSAGFGKNADFAPLTAPGPDNDQSLGVECFAVCRGKRCHVGRISVIRCDDFARPTHLEMDWIHRAGDHLSILIRYRKRYEHKVFPIIRND